MKLFKRLFSKYFEKYMDAQPPAETPVIPAPRDEADSVINIDAGEGDVPHERPDAESREKKTEKPQRKAS